MNFYTSQICLNAMWKITFSRKFPNLRYLGCSESNGAKLNVGFVTHMLMVFCSFSLNELINLFGFIKLPHPIPFYMLIKEVIPVTYTLY